MNDAIWGLYDQLVRDLAKARRATRKEGTSRAVAFAEARVVLYERLLQDIRNFDLWLISDAAFSNRTLLEEFAVQTDNSNREGCSW